MLAVYVYKYLIPNILAEASKPFGFWDRFQDFDCLLNSPYWKQKCDLKSPMYPKEKNCCPICTDSSDFGIITEPEYLGYCNGCRAVERLIDWKTAESTIPKIVVAQITGRPVVFYYLTTDSIDELVKKTVKSVNEIKDYWGI